MGVVCPAGFELPQNCTSRFAAASKEKRQSFQLRREAGTYSLEAPCGVCSGDYRFDTGSHTLKDAASGQVLGVFSRELVSASCLSESLQAPPEAPLLQLRCATVFQGDVVDEIQSGYNDGAFFVLPALLNGAACMQATEQVQEYLSSSAAGARAQTAVHPALGQFMLDNASREDRTEGIDAADEALQCIRTEGFSASSVNGLLQLPSPLDDVAAGRVLSCVRRHLHRLRVLLWQSVPPRGLVRDRSAWCDAEHRVGLVLAGVALDAVLEDEGGSPQQLLQSKVSECLLVAQYFGAMARVANLAKAPGAMRRMYLLPLLEDPSDGELARIAAAMSLAFELAEQRGFLRFLEIRVLAASAQEDGKLRRLLARHGKLAASP